MSAKIPIKKFVMLVVLFRMLEQYVHGFFPHSVRFFPPEVVWAHQVAGPALCACQLSLLKLHVCEVNLCQVSCIADTTPMLSWEGGGGGGGARDMYEAIGERFGYLLALTRTTAEHKELVEGM